MLQNIFNRNQYWDSLWPVIQRGGAPSPQPDKTLPTLLDYKKGFQSLFTYLQEGTRLRIQVVYWITYDNVGHLSHGLALLLLPAREPLCSSLKSLKSESVSKLAIPSYSKRKTNTSSPAIHKLFLRGSYGGVVEPHDRECTWFNTWF